MPPWWSERVLERSPPIPVQNHCSRSPGSVQQRQSFSTGASSTRSRVRMCSGSAVNSISVVTVPLETVPSAASARRDLVEGDAIHGFAADCVPLAKRRQHPPRNRLARAVGIGRQDEAVHAAWGRDASLTLNRPLAAGRSPRLPRSPPASPDRPVHRRARRSRLDPAARNGGFAHRRHPARPRRRHRDKNRC